MSSIFTSIGKVLTIKFLLIFLSIIFYIDIYFYLTYDVIFVEKYKDYLNIKDILIVTLFYLVTLNVIIPLIAFVFSFFGIVIHYSSYIINSDMVDKFITFLGNDNLENLSAMEEKAIKDNNSALMKSYELKLENYKELHTLYLFSFFILIELIYLVQLDIFSSQLIYKSFDLLYSNGRDDNFFSHIFLIIPSLLLILFSCRYISSFKSKKILDWIGKVK